MSLLGVGPAVAGVGALACVSVILPQRVVGFAVRVPATSLRLEKSTLNHLRFTALGSRRPAK